MPDTKNIASSALKLALLLFVVTVPVLSLNHPFWVDEAISMIYASLPNSTFWESVSHDTHPPLFYLLLKGWLLVVGDSEIFAHFLMYAAYALTVLALFFYGPAACGLIAATLFAISSLAVEFSTQVRPYSILTLVTLVATIRYLVWTERVSGFSWGKKAVFFWELFLYAVFLTYLHYYSAFILFGIGLAELVSSKSFKKTLLNLAPLILGSLLFLPWISKLLASVESNAGNYVQKIQWDEVVSTFLYLPYGKRGILMLAALTTVTLLFTKANPRSEKENEVLKFLLWSSLGSTIVAILISLYTPVFTRKFALPALAVFSLAAGLWLGSRKSVERIQMLLVLMVAAAGFVGVGNYLKEPLRSDKIVAERVAELVKENDLVVTCELAKPGQVYYLGKINPGLIKQLTVFPLEGNNHMAWVDYHRYLNEPENLKRDAAIIASQAKGRVFVLRDQSDPVCDYLNEVLPQLVSRTAIAGESCSFIDERAF